MADSVIRSTRPSKKRKSVADKVSFRGDIMKYELISQPRVKIEKISIISRQQMSHTAANSENDGGSEKMTLCVSENFKSPKLTEFSKLLESQLEKTSDGVLTESKPNCEEPKLSKEESQETRHLKELLLLHLDLIQQQQVILLMKDRQLQQVSKEKETVSSHIWALMQSWLCLWHHFAMLWVHLCLVQHVTTGHCFNFSAKLDRWRCRHHITVMADLTCK